MKLFLASQSPRRRELLKLAGFEFEILTAEFVETIDPKTNVYTVPEILARRKADAVFRQCELKKDAVVLCADTLVIFNEKIFGKPASESDALMMLESLSGRQHIVITGVCIRSFDKEISFSDSAKVFFRTLEAEELLFYIRNYNPFDKAGSYGIQDWLGVRIVEKVEGDYFNVMGLPVRKEAEALKQFGITAMNQ